MNNPTSHATTLSYVLPQSGPTRLTVHDVRGKLIAKLIDSERAAGSHIVTRDGRGTSGRAVPSGTYFARIEDGGQARSTKLIVSR